MADRAVGIPFAKEGIPFIGVAAGVTLLAGWLGWTVGGPMSSRTAMATARTPFTRGREPTAFGGIRRNEKDRGLDAHGPDGSLERVL